MFKITKNCTIDDLRTVFEGDIPSCHPQSFLQYRLDGEYVYIAKKDDEIAGFLIYSIWWGNCPFLELVKIRKKFQRDGCGTELLNKLKVDLKELGFKNLASSTEVINPLGLGFHDKVGFKKLNSLQLQHGEEQFYTMAM